MISIDEDALICDLAESYHIYDYKSLPVSKIAIFSVGLRDDSRIKMKMNGIKYPLNTILLAAAADRLSLLLWSRTEDGVNGLNQPQSILDKLIGDGDAKEVNGFDSPEDFENEWKRLVGGERNGY